MFFRNWKYSSSPRRTRDFPRMSWRWLSLNAPQQGWWPIQRPRQTSSSPQEHTSSSSTTTWVPSVKRFKSFTECICTYIASSGTRRCHCQLEVAVKFQYCRAFQDACGTLLRFFARCFRQELLPQLRWWKIRILQEYSNSIKAAERPSGSKLKKCRKNSSLPKFSGDFLGFPQACISLEACFNPTNIKTNYDATSQTRIEHAISSCRTEQWHSHTSE